MTDLAQRVECAELLPNDQYADLTAINAAAVVIDTKDYDRWGRALLLLSNEDFGANTTISVEHSDESSTGFTAVDAALITAQTSGAASAFGNLNTAGPQVRGLELMRCRRYLRVQFATAFTDKAASVYLIANQSEN
jgi:hypothetical protein